MNPTDITTKEAFGKFCQDKFPGKPYKWSPEYCYVQAGCRMGEGLHYEFVKGYVHLHIEVRGDWRGIRKYLLSKAPFYRIEIRDWGGRKLCDWMLTVEVESESDMYNAFLEIRDILEYHILKYEESLDNTTIVIDNVTDGLHSEILSVRELLDNKLSIPHYQRPYRWETQNVFQLLSDIQDSMLSDKSRYRIGSVILHNNEDRLDIIDGQQRITTILLTIKACGMANPIPDLRYDHSDSFLHIRNNFRYIKDWIEENIKSPDEFARYILEKCEFVMIIVKNLSEAFQMFDSQNGRGKELEAYNLLKAYHIRAMEQESNEMKVKCDQRWEAAAQYDATPMIEQDDNIDILKQIFNEQLYRSRQWSRGRAAGAFSKKVIGEFKGFTIDKNHPAVYPYQNPQLLQYLTSKFYHSTLEGTVATSNRFEYGDSDSIDPFANINQTIVNGRPFFDYIETYVEIYKQIFLNLGSFQLSGFKSFYYSYCLDYESDPQNADRERRMPLAYLPRRGAARTGDGYLRELYKSLVLVIFDKFGEKGLDRYYKTLYRLVYMTRLSHYQVRYKTVDELPNTMLGNCFAIIAQAKDLSELRKLEKIMSENLSRLVKKYDIGNGARKIEHFILNGRNGD